MILSAQNLCYQRGGRAIFRALTFTLDAGQLLHLHGANGSGKTSLIRLCAGLATKTDGQIICQTPCHYIAHQNGITERHTIKENLYFASGLMGAGEDFAARATPVLEQWQLLDYVDQPAAILSAGQARALALARLSLAPRALWLLDEPFAALDDARAQTLRQFMAQHRSGGGAVMIADHHQHFADATEINMDMF